MLTHARIEAARATRWASALLFLTDRCPVGCRHCSVDARADGPGITDWPMFEAVVEVLCGTESFRVIGVSGGEPFAERRGLDFATRRLAEAGKDIVLYTSGHWGRAGGAPQWIRAVLSRAGCVVLGSDAFHAERLPGDRVAAAIRSVRDAGAWLVVQSIGTAEPAAALLTRALGPSWSDHAEIHLTPLLTTGRGHTVSTTDPAVLPDTTGATALTNTTGPAVLPGTTGPAVLPGTTGPAALARTAGPTTGPTAEAATPSATSAAKPAPTTRPAARPTVLGRRLGPCRVADAPVVRYDGRVSACCNEAVIGGAGPAALRRQARDADGLREALAEFGGDGFFHFVSARGPGALTALPAFADLADAEFRNVCGLCWRMLRRTGSDRDGALRALSLFRNGGAEAFEDGGAEAFEDGGAEAFEDGGAEAFEDGGAEAFEDGGAEAFEDGGAEAGEGAGGQ